MQFRATIDCRSHVWREWRGAGRPVAQLSGVTFRWRPGNQYVTDILTADEIEALRGHESVRLEVAAVGHETPARHEEPSVPAAPAEPAPRVDPLAGQLPRRQKRR